MFGVKRFHQYLFGRKFTDHKPLQHLLSEERAVPPMASDRIQCWALTLSGYDYRIVENFSLGKRIRRPTLIQDLAKPNDELAGDLALISKVFISDVTIIIM